MTPTIIYKAKRYDHYFSDGSPLYTVEVNGEKLPSVTITPINNEQVFGWGYDGAYPKNLAISILCHYLETQDWRTLLSQDGFVYAFRRLYEDKIVSIRKREWQFSEIELGVYLDIVANDWVKITKSPNHPYRQSGVLTNQ
jgi:hypothetical protein